MGANLKPSTCAWRSPLSVNGDLRAGVRILGVAAASGPCPDPQALQREGLLCSGINQLPSLSGQLVGTEDALLQQLADSMLKEDCASTLKV